MPQLPAGRYHLASAAISAAAQVRPAASGMVLPPPTRGHRVLDAGRPRRTPRSQAGYSLVVLIVAITVMSVVVAAALPLWSKQIQRDKEEELISRGWQYAEAIRVFRSRFGRLPTTLDELIKARPRCIRQLYKDPITGDDFEPIFLGQPAVPVTPKAPGPDAEGADAGQGSTPNGQPKQRTVAAGPIEGVHSRSDKKSSLLFFGQDEYDQWQFRVQMIGGMGSVIRGVQAGGGGLVTNFYWLGRPEFSTLPAGPTNLNSSSGPSSARSSSFNGPDNGAASSSRRTGGGQGGPTNPTVPPGGSAE